MSQELVTPLRPEQEIEAAAAAALLNRELGDGLYRPEWLLEDAASATAGVWLVGSPVPRGAAVARLLAPADAGYYERFGAAATELFTGLVGSFEALAVEPASRRRGLGRTLTVTSLDWMRGQGCAAAVTLSWRSGREDASAELFRQLGMREGPTVERFYHEESLAEGWTCPVCRGPCVCSATLFALQFRR